MNSIRPLLIAVQLASFVVLERLNSHLPTWRVYYEREPRDITDEV